MKKFHRKIQKNFKIDKSRIQELRKLTLTYKYHSVIRLLYVLQEQQGLV